MYWHIGPLDDTLGEGGSGVVARPLCWHQYILFPNKAAFCLDWLHRLPPFLRAFTVMMLTMTMLSMHISTSSISGSRDGGGKESLSVVMRTASLWCLSFSREHLQLSSSLLGSLTIKTLLH